MRSAPFKERIPIAWRFWSKVEFTDSCWNWLACRNQDGYGAFGIGSRADGTRRIIGAHRWAYEFAIGPIPDGMEIDHICHTRYCVRPDHLQVVTPVMNKKLAEFDHLGQWQKSKTHCPSGHPYDEANTHIGTKGERKCRTCNRLRAIKWRANQRRNSAHDVGLVESL